MKMLALLRRTKRQVVRKVTNSFLLGTFVGSLGLGTKLKENAGLGLECVHSQGTGAQK